MSRHSRIVPDGFVHHVVNRGDHRETIFYKPDDFRAFVTLINLATEHTKMRILAYCVMRNHFHLVLWPYAGKDLSAYMQWLMNAHIQRYLKHYPPASPGHIYQGRYTNSLVQSDRHLLVVMRYVEANPRAAGLVARAEDYEWSSLFRRAKEPSRPKLTDGPVPRPADWLRFVNTPMSSTEVDKIQRAARRGAPFGDDTWVESVVQEHGLEHTLRGRGRPKAGAGPSKTCESIDLVGLA
jgi:putative transposase